MSKKASSTPKTASTSNTPIPAASASNGETINFESALNELENLISKMESGQLSLQDSLQSFESGIALSRACQESLKEAEQKVQILVDKNSKEQDNTFKTETFVVLEE